MAKIIMKGAEVSNALKSKIIEKVEILKSKGTVPSLEVIRVGNKPEDLSYESAIKKRMAAVGVEVKVTELPEDINQEQLMEALDSANKDRKVHGILVFRPLPKHLDEKALERGIAIEKDVDCINPMNMEKLLEGDLNGFAPCTPQGVMEMLEHYQIDLSGKNVTIIGRSMVVGKPLALMMLNKNATVTICHSKTEGMEKHCKNADVIVAAVGRPRFLKENMVRDNSIIVDVGINLDEKGKLCGDVDYDNVEPLVSNISPVPGGVGGVTATVLAKHVVMACENLEN